MRTVWAAPAAVPPPRLRARPPSAHRSAPYVSSSDLLRETMGIIRQDRVREIRHLRLACQRWRCLRRPTVVCGLLERVAKRKQPSFRKLAAEELDAHGQTLRGKSGGHREGWKPDERGEAAVVA